MKKLTVKGLVLFLFGCSVIGIFINFVLIKNIFALQGLAYIALIGLSVVMCGLVVYLLTFLIIKQEKRKFEGHGFGTFIVNGDGAEELINKISVHLTEIQQLNDYITNKNISAELSEIEGSMRKIQAQLKDKTINGRRIVQIGEFFEYYMPLVVKILNSYRRIEANELTGRNATETKTQISAVLPVIKKAFEKELDYMLTDEMIDITTDITVLEAMMSKDGLLDSDNHNI